MKQLTKAPSLKVANDTAVAAKLKELISDAEEGFRRVVKVGLYIEWIAANLPHGQLLPWISAHAPEVSQRTIYNWRNVAKNLCEWSGLKFKMLTDCEVPADKLLDLPVEKLPKQLQPCREKMEAALSESKSAKQLFLFLGFKQAEIDPNTGYPRAKRGRLKGEGGASREQRATHKQKLRELTLNELKHGIRNFGDACDQYAVTVVGDPEVRAEFEAAFAQLENCFRIWQGIAKARGAQ